MTITLQGPLLEPAKAARLLDDVISERVFGCIDLEALCMIEVDLWVALSQCDAAADDDATKQLAKAMIDRALRRLPDDDRRYLPMRPFGMECSDCEDEVRHSAKPKRGTSPSHGGRR